jgi:hypothetical protein
MKIKTEISLNVTNDKDRLNFTPVFNGYAGNMLTPADSAFSRRMQTVLEDDEENSEEEEMILEKRVYSNGKYQLCETLENIDENIIASAAKSVLLGIPGVDTVLGSGFVAKYGVDLAASLSSLGAATSKLSGVSEDGVINGFLGSDEEFRNLVSLLQNGSKELRLSFKEGMDGLLEIFKKLIMTAFQSYDSIPALIGIAGSPAGLAVTETIANLTTAVVGFIGDNVPIERFIFEIATGKGEIISGILEFLEKWNRAMAAILTIGGSEVIRYFMKKLIGLGGPMFEKLIDSPVELFQRLGDLYRASGENSAVSIVKDSAKNMASSALNFMSDTDGFDIDLSPGDMQMEYKKYSLALLIEEMDRLEKEEFDEIDLGEMSTGGIGGYSLPLGTSNKPKSKRNDHHRLREIEKAVNEQRESISLLQAYHHKTTNKLK